MEAVRYELLSILGEGGFGRVYRARVQGLDGFEKQVAVKLLTDPNPPDEILQRFRDEARLLGLVRDRAVVAVDAPVRIEGRWAVVMELADGVSCRELLRKGLVPPGVACEIVGEVARALHVLHHHLGPDGQPLALVHRDIKPDNIQVAPSGSVKVLDFGIAKAAFRSREAVTGHLIGGTVGYMAPERLEGEEGPEADIYSLGVVLHELIAGRRPSLTEGRAETAFVRGSPLAEEDPSALIELSARMRSLEPDLRPTAREVERECRGLRGRLQGVWLSDWAERHVPSSPAVHTSDPLLRKVLTAELTPAELTPSAPALTTPTLAQPPRAGNAPGRRNRLALALAAALGLSGSGLVALAALLGGAGLVALSVWLLLPAQKSEPDELSIVEPPVFPVTDGIGAPEPPPEPPVEPEPAPVEPEVREPMPSKIIPAQPVPDKPVADEPVAGKPVADKQPAKVVPTETPETPPEAAPQPDPVATWPIVLISDPAGAEIYLDGRGPVGRTPVTLELPAGRYVVRMKGGGAEGTTTIRVGKNMPRTHAWRASEAQWSSGY